MRKGFTLIEMLGVIVILSIIGLITIPIVSNVMKESKENLSDSQKELIIKAARVYANEHVFDDSFTITVDKLMEEGYLEKNNDLKDKYTVKIKKQNGKFNFTVTKKGELEIDSTFVPQYYRNTSSSVVIGNSYDISSWTTDPATLNKSYYLGHDVSGSGSTRTVTANYACFILEDTQYCFKGREGASGAFHFDENKEILNTLKTAGVVTCSTWSTSSVVCGGGDLQNLALYNYGNMAAGTAQYKYCVAASNGNSYCYY